MAQRILYLGTDDGVLTLSLDHKQVTVKHQGLQGWSIEELAVAPSDSSRVLAGTRGDGVWLSQDGGASWRKPCYGKPGPGKVRCLTLDPKEPRRVFAGAEPIEVYVSENFGASWQPINSVRSLPFIASVDYVTWAVEPHVRDIAVDPADSGTLYVALQVGAIIKTADGGVTWKRLDQGLDTDVHTIVVDADHPHVVVIATGGHDHRAGTAPGRALYRSADGGETWSPVASQFQQEYSVPLVPNPQNPHELYAGLAAGHPGMWSGAGGANAIVVRSRDGGRTWNAVDTGTARSGREFVQAIAVDPSRSGTVCAAAGTSLIVTDDGGDSWEQLGTGYPRINDLKWAGS